MNTTNTSQNNTTNGKLSTWANIAQIGQFVLQIAGIVLPLITVGILSSQEQPLKIPVLDVSAGVEWQFVLVLCAGLIYLQLLSSYWQRQRMKGLMSESYLLYLVKDLPTLRPLFLVPAIFIIGFFVKFTNFSIQTLASGIIFIVCVMIASVWMPELRALMKKVKG